MTQGGNDVRQAPKIRAKTNGEKFNIGTEKIKSLYSFARIYKVFEDLRKLNECTYVPRLIAIGPHHRKGEHLQKPMQDVKMDYANRQFLRLTKGITDPEIRDEKKDELIQECVEKMKKCTVKAEKYNTEEEVTLVDMAMKYYAEDLKLNEDDMVEMMLVDVAKIPTVDQTTGCCPELSLEGVKFVPTKKELFDVKFINKGVGCWGCRTLAFRIPTIHIRKTTESFLRNIIALEQCSPRVPRYFTSYAKLMDITDKDVRALFNKLCKEVVLEDFHFDMVCQEASKFNMRWRTRAVRYVTRLFVAFPWPALAFFMGIATFAIALLAAISKMADLLHFIVIQMEALVEESQRFGVAWRELQEQLNSDLCLFKKDVNSSLPSLKR
ncbi:hypothetical protein C3L33_20426, partial [Rhododendron williamsianum]